MRRSSFDIHTVLGALSVAILVLAAGCSVKVLNRQLTPPDRSATLDRASPYLKAHMRDGSVYVLRQWSVDDQTRTVSGTGELLGLNRESVRSGALSLALDSVAIFETNRVSTSPAVSALAVVTGASAVVTIACLANPKACFGSCPTFYASDGTDLVLQAEGFSTSIAPSLEASDIDALYRAHAADRRLRIVMTNEALETHVVRAVHLLAVPRIGEGRVFRTAAGEFWQAEAPRPPRACASRSGDCLPLVQAFDEREYYSRADSTDLATREEIELQIDAPDGDAGLVIAARQTLLTTYLLYQGLAYMGSSAAEWIARYERGHGALRDGGLGYRELLGGIEVFVQNEHGEWLQVGEVHETGPIASDVHLVPLPELRPGPARVKLRLTRGHWRLDHIAVARLAKRVEALRIAPTVVRKGNVEDAQALARLLDQREALVTLPGDRYEIDFELPDEPHRYELFLESRGYYLEWMRDEWVQEEDPSRALRLLAAPRWALRELAPEYAAREPELEKAFWGSRYVTR